MGGETAHGFRINFETARDAQRTSVHAHACDGLSVSAGGGVAAPIRYRFQSREEVKSASGGHVVAGKGVG